METTWGDVTRAVILIAIIVIIYYFYEERKLIAAEKTNTIDGSYSNENPAESFVKGMWEGDESVYRARAHAFYSCPASDCAQKEVYAEDLISVNPFRWPISGGNYYLGNPEEIKSRKSEAGGSALSGPQTKTNGAGTEQDMRNDNSTKQQQDHEVPSL